MAKKKTSSILIGVGVAALVAVGIAYAVKPKIKVSITANPVTGSSPLQVSFNSSAEEGASPYSYVWDFGDGNVSNLQNPINTYQTAGSYTAKVTVTDAEGKTASKSIAIIVTGVGGEIIAEIISISVS